MVRLSSVLWNYPKKMIPHVQLQFDGVHYMDIMVERSLKLKLHNSLGRGMIPHVQQWFEEFWRGCGVAIECWNKGLFHCRFYCH